MIQEKCEDCRFFQDAGSSSGYCRRYPPTVYSSGEYNDTCSCSPFVRKDEWCGEFHSKSSPMPCKPITKDGCILIPIPPVQGKIYGTSESP